MNDASRPPSPPSSSSTAEPAMPGLPAELAHLFRHSLRDSLIHPLMPMVQHYRQALRDAATPPGDAS